MPPLVAPPVGQPGRPVLPVLPVLPGLPGFPVLGVVLPVWVALSPEGAEGVSLGVDDGWLGCGMSTFWKLDTGLPSRASFMAICQIGPGPSEP